MVASLTSDAGALGAIGLLELLLVLEGGKGVDQVCDAARLQLLQKLRVAHIALGAEAGRPQGECLLGLQRMQSLAQTI